MLKVCPICGKEFEVSSKHPNQKFCSYFCSAQSRVKDLTGKKFGKLLVISRADYYISPKGKPVIRYLCRCDCGTEKIIRGNDITQHHTTSCGCEISKRPSKLFKKHGNSTTRLYKIWIGIKSRCYYKKDTNYKNYGERGIIVCNEWQKSFANFQEWAIANGYTDELTIDRINVNGNYEPSNCRWATDKEQANNRTNNYVLTYNNETHTLSEWSRIVGICRSTLFRRLKRGLSVERVLTTPVKSK